MRLCFRLPHSLRDREPGPAQGPPNHNAALAPAPFFTPIAALILLALLAVLLVLAVRESYWLDEGHTLRRVEAAWPQLYYPFAAGAETRLLPPFDPHDVFDLNPPLYFILARLLAGAHPGPLAMRLFSAVPMVLALLFMALYARRVHGLPGALAVLLIGATAPATLYYGHEARPYALPLAVACAMVWLAAVYWDRPRRLFAAFTLGTAAGCLMHFAFAWWGITLGAVFGTRFLYSFHTGDRAVRRAALAAAFGAAAGALLALAALIPQWGIFAQCRIASSWPLTSHTLMTAYAFPFCRVGLSPVAPWFGCALQYALVIAMLLLLSRSPRRGSGVLALLCWLTPLALAINAKWWLNVAFIERYTFTALAGWLMALAWTAREAAVRPGRPRALAGALLAAMLATNLAWAARNLPRPLRPQWRQAIEYLKSRATARDAYTIDPDAENHCFAANAATPPAAQYFFPDTGFPAQAEAIWVLADESIEPRWDDRHLENKNRKVEHIAGYNGVELYRLVKIKK